MGWVCTNTTKIIDNGKELRKTFEESYSVDTSQYFKPADTLNKAKLTLDDIPQKQDVSVTVLNQASVSGNPLKERITRPRPTVDAKCSVSSRI